MERDAMEAKIEMFKCGTPALIEFTERGVKVFRFGTTKDDEPLRIIGDIKLKGYAGNIERGSADDTATH